MKYIALLAGLLVTGLASAQMFTFSHTWNGTEPTMATRLFRNGVPSVYGTPKAFPGTSGGPGIFYQTYTITNNLGSLARLDTTTSSPNLSINSFTAVYLGTFDPTNLATNYFGDEGSSPGANPTSASYGPFNPAATITVVSMSVTSAPPAGSGYSIQAVLSPVPEPATMAVLGLGALSLIRRRRAKA